ncbi:MAG: hypothetical protein NZ988_01805 [Thaumarchaeota archaeon]|nr:hypothetical protein [Candidatus Calditenuaceae archaeon]MDW8186770.1 hypothetical protein [Nitrososphaerota archaeon]
MDERLERTVVKFVQTLFEGRYSDAERIAENLEKRSKGELDAVVSKVLKGLHLAYTTDDSASLIHKIYSSDNPKSELERYVSSMRDANGDLEEASTIIEVWDVILKNFERLPIPDRYERKSTTS